MTETAQKQQFLACLSDPSRFSLVTTLIAGPRCVTDLATIVGLSQSCTTRHLQALLREGIVSGERQGKRVVYALCPLEPGAHPVLRWACGTSEPAKTTVPGQTPRGATAMDKSTSAVGSEDRGLRRTRQRADAVRPPTTRLEESIEVTDTLIVAHDSAWQAADEEQESGETRRTTVARVDGHSARPTAVRAELDDFLL
ncbi:MAG: metalloregulator ArsR/SmtB family transcription factor [Candidatus Eisenbacteria bacterium]